MTQRKNGWHRVSIEWCDEISVSHASLEFRGSDAGISGIDEHELGETIACVLRQSGMNDFRVLAHALTSIETKHKDEDTVLDAVSRLLHRRRQ